jgi:CRISPR-associated endoribonuclease Cas6
MPQLISMVLRPKDAFEMPWSEGYQLYSAILSIMRRCDEATARHTHDSPLGSISISTLEGGFRRSQRPKHKVADPANTYKFKIGITDPQEADIFRAIVSPLILREQDIKLEKGALRVEEATSSMASFEEIIASAGKEECRQIEFSFLSPTCIKYRNSDVIEMFPHREAVFSSLAAKWNSVCPEGLKFSIEREEMARYLMEQPLSYETHSVMVNTFNDAVKGHPRPRLMQGFQGCCRYLFTKDAPRDIRNAILALSRFAEYSGVGSTVARGCGAVKVRVGEVER